MYLIIFTQKNNTVKLLRQVPYCYLQSCFLRQCHQECAEINPCHILVFPDYLPMSQTDAHCNLHVKYAAMTNAKTSVDTKTVNYNLYLNGVKNHM